MATTLHQALEEVENRFLYLGDENMSVDRLFMAVEQAWWYYEDFFADVYESCPHYKTLNKFSKQLFEHCPLLTPYKADMDQLLSDFNNYKGKIPSYGCILLNPSMTKMLLAKSYQGNNWTFPKGKVNEDERDNPLKCACRETFEEIGYDPTPNCRKDDELTILDGEKFVRLYIGTDVYENFNFVPQTRKEISEIRFFDIGDCENKKIKTYHVFPFIKGIRRFIAKRKKNGGRSASSNNLQASESAAKSGKKAKKKDISNPKILSILENPNNSSSDNVKRSESGSKLRDINARNKDTFAGEGQGKSGAKGWAVDQMMKKNEEMTGRKIEYDGSSNNFGSSHPRFVNYLEQDKLQNGSAIGNEKVSVDEHTMILNEMNSMERELMETLHSNGFSESKKQDFNGKEKAIDTDDMTLFKPVFRFDMNAIRAAMKPNLVLSSTSTSSSASIRSKGRRAKK